MRFFILPLCIICLGCQQMLVPAGYDPKVHDVPYDKIEDEGLVIYMENMETTNEQLVFDLEVINNTAHTIYFNPQEIHYYRSDRAFQEQFNEEYLGKARQNQAVVWAKNERKVNRYYENKIKSAKRAQTAIALIGIGLMVFDAVQDVRDVSEGTLSAATRAATRDVVVGTSLVAVDVAGQELEAEKMEAAEDLHFLPDEILLGGEIPPDASIRGKVFFPTDYVRNYYRFVVPVSGYYYIYDFRKARPADLRKIRRL